MMSIKLAKLRGAAEIFYSIQGEGKNMGQPSIFIRSSMCNLHCIWCDTDYTWNWENTRFQHVRDAEPGYQKYKMSEHIVECSIEAIVQEVQQYPCTNIVLTGGEPMLQQEALVDLMRTLKSNDANYFFEVETNGTLLPHPAFDNLINQYNVSAKLENSNNPRKLREKPAVYQHFSTNKKALFKFVLAEEQDLSEILELIERYHIPAQKVYLMAEGVLPEQLRSKQQWLVEICKKHGFHFTDRLHIQLYGDKKGV